jgi:myo-inositol-hexaphosphate 3-phosphohydrolase
LGACSPTISAKTSSLRYAAETEVAPPAVLKSTPNPFRDKTIISFSLTQDKEYTLAVYDLKGALMQQLPAGKVKAQELQQVTWQAPNLAAGVYILKLTSRTGVQHLRLVRE